MSELQPQLAECGVDYEIIIEDDASPDWTIRHHNSLLGELENITYIEHTENLGRSKTRNHLADTAKYPHLLFIDGDARMKSKTYIADYLKFIDALPNKEKPYAVSGGLAYHVARPKKEQRLRYKYGIYREVRPAFIRNRNPYQNFTPFNLLVSKSVFEICRFDETLTDYGYEDTFFGMELEERHIPVSHINNELYHDGLDTNHDFLHKIEASVHNLNKLCRDGKVNDRFRAQSRLLQKWESLHKRRISPLFFNSLRIMRPLLMKLIMKSNSLKAMDLYKLVLFDDLQNSRDE